jgi:hypothetical protein
MINHLFSALNAWRTIWHGQFLDRIIGPTFLIANWIALFLQTSCECQSTDQGDQKSSFHLSNSVSGNESEAIRSATSQMRVFPET